MSGPDDLATPDQAAVPPASLTGGRMSAEGPLADFVDVDLHVRSSTRSGHPQSARHVCFVPQVDMRAAFDSFGPYQEGS